MKRLLMVYSAALLHTTAVAQHWSNVGLGPAGIGPTQVKCLYGDTVMDRLLAGGQFFKYRNDVDTVWAFSRAQWNGARWDSLGSRVQPGSGSGEIAPEAYWYLRYQGNLYTCGDFGFSTPGGYNSNIARLDAPTMQWEDLGCLSTVPNGLRTLVPKEPQETLYATGFADILCGQFPPTCVYSYDGSTFVRWAPFDQFPEVPLTHVTYIFEFRGKTYMVGVFPGPGGQGVASFLRFNGSVWELVPGWNNLMASIWDYTIRNDTLYVGGDFLEVNGGPGNLVASFDGEQWNNLGGGFRCNDCWSAGSVNALQWFNGELWACGMFDQVLDIPAHGIAKWDGQRWCVLPGGFLQASLVGSPLYDMTVWRDSLYMCGLFESVDGVPAHQIVQWIGGDAVEDCSTVGIGETVPPTGLVVSPIAEPGRWAVHFPKEGSWVLAAYDAIGRMVDRWHVVGSTVVIDLGNRPLGLYLLRTGTPEGAWYSAKVLR